MSITSAYPRDANSVPITNLGLTVTKSITYLTATTGAVGTATLFTVTGTVAVRVFGYCTADLTGAGATVEVGIAGNTAAIIAQTTGTNIDSAEFWNTATPVTVGSFSSTNLLLKDTNIIQTIATAAVDTGALTYFCIWAPVSSDGNVAAA